MLHALFLIDILAHNKLQLVGENETLTELYEQFLKTWNE